VVPERWKCRGFSAGAAGMLRGCYGHQGLEISAEWIAKSLFSLRFAGRLY
jgi:hypothetical protein